MALDGILLSKIIPEIQKSLPARIQKIYQISTQEILFQIYGTNGKEQLLISCHSEYNRMLLSRRSYPTPQEPGNFAMILRKYLEGATFLSLQQAELDRWCFFQIQHRNVLGDPETIRLYVELMGKYANLILVDPSEKIIGALKRIPPFENNKRIIQPGALFRPTPAQNKHNPFHTAEINSEQTLTQQFTGISPFLAKEIDYRIRNGQNFSSVMREIKDSRMLYIAQVEPTPLYHCIPLTSLEGGKQYPLFEGFDVLYYHKEEKDRIREISGDIFRVVKRELKHQTLKLPRLLKEYDEAKDNQKWNTYGLLLYSHGIRETHGATAIALEDFETGQNVTVPLDPRLNGPRNAQKCFAKYQKLKKGQIYLTEQIAICQAEIQYFTGLLEQLEQADFTTAEEIKQELIKGGYMMSAQKKRSSAKEKTHKIDLHTVRLPNGILLSYGKNNMQNDFLTWHKAKKNELWFHAKDYHGAHVVLHEARPDEETIRIAAMTAAYFSKGRQSSSVPVNWCPIQELKKIPGAKLGMVQLGHYRTIYIDPDETKLEQCGIIGRTQI